MKTSQRGIDLIKSFEGLRLSAYQDAVGVWTIGYGHTRSARAGMRIDHDEAERWLRQDLYQFEDCVDELVDVALSQAQFDAIVSFAFNVGCGALHGSTFLRRLNAGRYDEAAAEFMRWIHAGGRPLDGLRRRRRAERELFESEPAPTIARGEDPLQALPWLDARGCAELFTVMTELQTLLGVEPDGIMGTQTYRALAALQDQ
jgi:lysozyme